MSRTAQKFDFFKVASVGKKIMVASITELVQCIGMSSVPMRVSLHFSISHLSIMS